ncbi:MAG: hypothetical protein ABI972_27395 [Acidobacteriota bacterium]
MLRYAFLAAALTLSLAAETTVQILDQEGKLIEGPTSLAAITVKINGAAKSIPLSNILSIHTGRPASAYEAGRIEADIKAIQSYTNEIIGSDARRNRDAAVEELTNIGLPAMTPLLQAYKDTDQHEPRPLYRLFERVMPSDADQLDRQASLIRLASGEAIRGEIQSMALKVGGGIVDWGHVRRLAVRRATVTRSTDLHSLRHSTQIEYLDTGVLLSASSAVIAHTTGFVRLSWDVDGWACDADGLKVPGPKYNTNLVDGQPFGAVVGRVGAAGDVIFAGKQYSGKSLPAGRLHFAVNDNRHWQNNLGSFHVKLTATNAYDVGAAQ